MKTDLIALKKKSSQANTTPRSETQVLLELEETQAEIVGPAEIFLRLWLVVVVAYQTFVRPGSKLELHCKVSLGLAGPDDHFR